MRSTLLLPASFLLAFAAAAAAQDAPPSADASIPPIVEQWAAAWNDYDAAGMAALFTEDGVYRDEAFQGTFTGREGIATWVEITADAIPKSELEVIDAFQAGDRVAVRWVFHGTPLRFGPLQATGESFSVPVVSVLDMEGDLIRQVTDFYNLADVFRQVGVDPSDWVPPNP